MKANRAGEIAENIIADLLKGLGIDFDRERRVGPGFFKRDRIVDFLARNFSDFPDGVIIESKWQDRSGSIDEKFLYLVENIKMTPIPTIVIVHGGGAAPGAVRWLRDHVGRDNLVAVYGLDEFISWASRAQKGVGVRA